MPPEPWDPPRHADLISITWNNPVHRSVPDDAPPANPKDFADVVCFDVGVEGHAAGTRCQSALWTTARLKAQCRADGFIWPRGLALIEEFQPRQTLSDLELEIGRLCRLESADGYEALLNSFDKYGWHPYEVKAVFADKDRFAPLEGKLLGINYARFTAAEPDDPSHFGDMVRIRIGVSPSTVHREDYEYFHQQHGLAIGRHEAEFEFRLCTPSWFEASHDFSHPVICQHVAFVDRFDRTRIETAVAQQCRDCCGFEEREVTDDMKPYATPIDRQMVSV